MSLYGIHSESHDLRFRQQIYLNIKHIFSKFEAPIPCIPVVALVVLVLVDDLAYLLMSAAVSTPPMPTSGIKRSRKTSGSKSARASGKSKKSKTGTTGQTNWQALAAQLGASTVTKPKPILKYVIIWGVTRYSHFYTLEWLEMTCIS